MTDHIVTPEEIRRAFSHLAQHVNVLETIAGQVTEATGISLEHMRKETRSQAVVHARWLVMWKADKCDCTMSQIGRFLNRNRATVTHGIAAMQQLQDDGYEYPFTVDAE